MSTCVLETRELKIGYTIKGKRKQVAEGINLSLHSGQLICLLGPNGAGKSTLIKTFCSLLSPLHGCVHLCGDDLKKLSPLEIAHRLSLVLTDRIETEIAVYDVVALGRAPYTDWKGSLTEHDHGKIRWAIQITGIKKFLQQKITELSDGEQQKVMIARALAQDTPLIILDEPTAHLDLPNRVEIFRLLRTMAHETGKAILLSTHELDLALQASDNIWMMEATSEMKTGAPEDLILNGTVESVFQRNGLDFNKTTGAFQFHKPGIYPVELIGEGAVTIWTQRALERNGFYITERFDAILRVEIMEHKSGAPCWVTSIGDSHQQHHSIEMLIHTLKNTNLKTHIKTI